VPFVRFAEPREPREPRGELREPPARHAHVGEPAGDRVGGVEPDPGERDMRAQLAGRAGEQPGSADVGDVADRHLGHRELGALGDDPDAAVCRHPDPAAHDKAVHERDVGLGVAGDPGVEPVLLGEQRRELVTAPRRVLVEVADVAAGAEPALAGPVHEHRGDGAVVLPIVEGAGQRADHGQVERVELRGPVECEPPECSLAADEDALAHANAGGSWRAASIRLGPYHVSSRPLTSTDGAENASGPSSAVNR
jgi:hypothetical protein